VDADSPLIGIAGSLGHAWRAPAGVSRAVMWWLITTITPVLLVCVLGRQQQRQNVTDTSSAHCTAVCPSSADDCAWEEGVLKR